MRCTSCFIVTLRGIDAGGDRQPTQNLRKRQKAPVCKTQTGAEELYNLFTRFLCSYQCPEYSDGGYELFLTGADHRRNRIVK